jgi:hypothetical protein
MPAAFPFKTGMVVFCTGLLSLAATAQKGSASDPYVLNPTPATVAWGYYWSEAAPVLRVHSGDYLNVRTVLTSSPDRLEAAGVRSPAQGGRTLEQRPAMDTRRQPGQQGTRRRNKSFYPGACQRRAVGDRRRSRCPGQWRSRYHRDRNLPHRPPPARRPQGQAPTLAKGRDTHALYCDGDRPGPQRCYAYCRP